MLTACGSHTHVVAAPTFAAATSDTGCEQSLHLRYRVTEPDGEWTWEIVRRGGRYVERRVRVRDGAEVVLGRDERGRHFVRAGERAHAAGAVLTGQIANRAALFGGELRCHDRPWRRRGPEYFFRPPDGGTIGFLVPSRAALPAAWDHTDAIGRLRICEELAWERRAGASIPTTGICRTSNSRRWTANPRALPTAFVLEEARRPTELPAWATGEVATLPPPRTSQFPLLDPVRPRVLVSFGDGPPLDLIVDTGAFATVLDARAAERAGVVPLGGVSLYIDPPWLPAGANDVGVAERIRVGDIELPATPIFLQDGLGSALDGDGLLGMDVLRQLVLDIDGPARQLRFHPLGFDARALQPDATVPLASSWRSVRVDGAVHGIGRGTFIVDTGAAVAAVVSARGLGTAYPRRHGDPIPRPFTEVGGPVDWHVRLRGLRVGPYDFPATPAWGRYHEQEDVDVNGLGLVGMDVLRFFRVVFSLRDREMHFVPGDEYRVLTRWGIELDDDEEGVRIVRAEVAEGERAPWRLGDVITQIQGVPVHRATTARRLLAGVRGARVRLGLRRSYRDGSEVERTIDIANR